MAQENLKSEILEDLDANVNTIYIYEARYMFVYIHVAGC
jgi:hypothetical protein